MRAIETKQKPDLYFEDFTEGQVLETVTKGPMMVGHQVRWAGACDNYDAEYHHDEYVAKELGFPGIILSGPLMASYLLVAVRDWLGRNAVIERFYDRNSGSTMPRDVASLKGKISSTYERDGKCYVDLECWVENQKGEITTPGGAVAVLPSRAAA